MKLKNLIALAIVIALFLSTSCKKDIFCSGGSGDIITNTLNVSEFSKIDLAIASNIIITQGDDFNIEATGHSNAVNRIDTYVSNNTWRIEFEDGKCFNNYDLTINITVPDINAVSVCGSGDVVINDFIDQNKLDLDVTGSGNIDFNTFEGAQYISASISGSGNIRGNREIDSINKLDIRISGSGKFKGYPIITDDCEIKISGSGNCYVNVNNNLDVKISGSGNVYYLGTPSINSNIIGSGSLIKVNK